MPRPSPCTWTVRVHRAGESIYLGTVREASEALARCAALSVYGITEEEVATADPRTCILPEDEFDVSPA